MCYEHNVKVVHTDPLIFQYAYKLIKLAFLLKYKFALKWGIIYLYMHA